MLLPSVVGRACSLLFLGFSFGHKATDVFFILILLLLVDNRINLLL